MGWTFGLLAVTVGCTAGQSTEMTTEGPAFSAPWEAQAPVTGRVRGAFDLELGEPGSGLAWFDGPDVSGNDVAAAEVRQVPGASSDVLQVRISGFTPDGWSHLEFDIALAHWRAGEVPVDGEAVIGHLSGPGVAPRFVLGGALQVTAPGIEDGQRVEATFRGLSLVEAP